MPKFSKPLLITCAIFYFLFLVFARIPAAWVAYTVHQAVPSLWLTSVSGTVWNGLARGAQIEIEETPIAMGALRWHINPWSLLMLSPCIAFDTQFANQPLEGQGCVGITGIKIKDLTIDVPLHLVQEMMPIEVDGTASINIIEASFTSEKVNHLNARLALQNARINPDGSWMTLGSFAAVLSDDNGGIAAQVMDIDAPFAVDLSVSYTLGEETVNAMGTIEPSELAPDNAVSAIQILGEEVEDGVYYIQWP